MYRISNPPYSTLINFKSHHYKSPDLAGLPLWPALQKHRKLHCELDITALKINKIMMVVSAGRTLLLILAFYV